MEYLFNARGLKNIRGHCTAETLFAFDFDGTLSKISFQPEHACIADKTQRLLNRLSEIAPTAIISGRNTADLKNRLGFKPQYLIGNHGISGLAWGKSLGRSAQRTCQHWKNHILQFLEKINIPGVEMEDNRFTLAIHYRQTIHKSKAKKALLEYLMQLSPPPHIVMGKCVINAIPQKLPNKGDAFLKLLKLTKVKSAIYIGDDHTDENIFALSRPNLLTGRIGYKKESRAQYYLRRQSEINKLLQIILDTIRPELNT